MTSPEARIRAAADSAHERSPIRAAQRERNLARFGVPDYPGGQLGDWPAGQLGDVQVLTPASPKGQRGPTPTAVFVDELPAEPVAPVEQAVAAMQQEQDGAVARARARMKKDPVFTEPERVWDPATKRWVG